MKGEKTGERLLRQKKAKLNIEIPLDVYDGLDPFVDGIHYQTKTHIVTVILSDWITRENLRRGRYSRQEQTPGDERMKAIDEALEISPPGIITDEERVKAIKALLLSVATARKIIEDLNRGPGKGITT